jgi:hypothetical protein
MRRYCVIHARGSPDFGLRLANRLSGKARVQTDRRSIGGIDDVRRTGAVARDVAGGASTATSDDHAGARGASAHRGHAPERDGDSWWRRGSLSCRDPISSSSVSQPSQALRATRLVEAE